MHPSSCLLELCSSLSAGGLECVGRKCFLDDCDLVVHQERWDGNSASQAPRCLHIPYRATILGERRSGQGSGCDKVHRICRTGAEHLRGLRYCKSDTVSTPPLHRGSHPAMPKGRTRQLVSYLRLCRWKEGFLCRNDQLCVLEMSRTRGRVVLQVRVELTSNFVVYFYQMEGLAANGTTICFSGPCFKTRVVEDMAAYLNNCNVVVVDDVVDVGGDIVADVWLVFDLGGGLSRGRWCSSSGLWCCWSCRHLQFWLWLGCITTAIIINTIPRQRL